MTDSAADRLLPPLKTDDIFKRTKGKVANLMPPKEQIGEVITDKKKGKKGRSSRSNSRYRSSPFDHRASGSQSWKQRRSGSYAAGGSKGFKAAETLTARDKASGIAKGKTEAVIKFDKASKGIKTRPHLEAALDYMLRHGELDAENGHGEVMDLETAGTVIDEWCTDQKIPVRLEDDKKNRPADARRCIVSCPPGTDPAKVKEAARQLGREIFEAQGFEYFMVLHYRDDAHPREPEHPHVHFLIKAVNREGRRLNLRKEDLRYMRERFAVIAREHGIELNATSRAVRGKTEKAKTQAQIHQEERYKSQAQKWAIERKKKELAERKGKEPEKPLRNEKDEVKPPKMHPYQKERRDELLTALREGRELEEHPVLTKARNTREKVRKNTEDYIRELRSSGKAEDLELAAELEKKAARMKEVESVQQQKLRIARRKAAEKLKEKEGQQKGKGKKEKQTQAQKWAIERKKKARAEKEIEK